jgi:hypothetical protein
VENENKVVGELSRVGDRGLREKADRRAAGRSNFNADKTRYICREFLGWVCYTGAVGKDGNFTGRRVGVVAEESVAERWLAGDDNVTWDIPADPSTGNLQGR